MRGCYHAQRASFDVQKLQMMQGVSIESSMASIVVHGQGASVQLEDHDICGGDVGVQVQGGAHLSARKLHAMNIYKQAIFVQGTDSTAELHGCTLESFDWSEVFPDPLGQEIPKADEESELLPWSIEDARTVKVLLLGARSVGVLVTEGGRAKSTDVMVKQFDCGFMSRQGAQMLVDTCQINSGRVFGCLVADASLIASKLTVCGGTSVGCGVIGSSTAQLTAGNIQGSKHHEVVVAGALAVLHIDKGSFSSSWLSCVQIVDGARACIKNASVRTSARKCGILCAYAGSHVRIEGCWIRGNQECAVEIACGAEAVVQGCHSRGNKTAGYTCHNGGKLTISRSHSQNDGWGVLAFGVGSTVDACETHVRHSHSCAFMFQRSATCQASCCNSSLDRLHCQWVWAFRGGCSRAGYISRHAGRFGVGCEALVCVFRRCYERPCQKRDNSIFSRWIDCNKRC